MAIPTTVESRSECTRFTIITDSTIDEKMLCAGLAFLPTIALVDYRLTMQMPPRLTRLTVEVARSKAGSKWRRPLPQLMSRLDS